MPGWLGFAYYMQREYTEAVPLLRECVSRAPNFRGGHFWLAATYARLEKLAEARAEAAEVLCTQLVASAHSRSWYTTVDSGNAAIRSAIEGL